MSLIFEALKKLERERDTTERGFQVIAHTPWPARSRMARIALMALAAGALAGAGAWGAWTWLSSSRRAAAPSLEVRPAVAAQAPRAPLPPPIWEPSPAPGRPAAALSPATPATTAPAAPSASPEPPLLVIAPRDPAPAPTTASLRLEAISAQDGEPVAVINGQLVRTGDTIEGAVVVWIGADAVEVEADGQRRVLKF